MSIEIKAKSMELLITQITQSMFYGGFKVETNNELEWFKLMNDMGLWLNDEDKMISKVTRLKSDIKNLIDQ